MPTPQSRPQVRPGIVLLVLCLAQFMLVLDISVTNPAPPRPSPEHRQADNRRRVR